MRKDDRRFDESSCVHWERANYLKPRAAKVWISPLDPVLREELLRIRPGNNANLWCGCGSYQQLVGVNGEKIRSNGYEKQQLMNHAVTLPFDGLLLTLWSFKEKLWWISRTIENVGDCFYLIYPSSPVKESRYLSEGETTNKPPLIRRGASLFMEQSDRQVQVGQNVFSENCDRVLFTDSFVINTRAKDSRQHGTSVEEVS